LKFGAVRQALKRFAESVGRAGAPGVEREPACLVAEVALEQQVEEGEGGAVRRQLVMGRPGEWVERRQAIFGAAPDDG